jgi:uncharacterized membrane protein YhaH (DUF805 family)
MEILIIIGASILMLNFWAIIDLTRSRFMDPTKRTIWLVLVLFFPFIGSILYFQLRKKFTTKEPRKFQPKFNRA